MFNLNPIQLLKMKNNPVGFAQSLLNANPNMKGIDKLQKAIEFASRGDEQNLQKLANEICSERNTSPDMVGGYIKNQYGF